MASKRNRGKHEIYLVFVNCSLSISSYKNDNEKKEVTSY